MFYEWQKEVVDNLELLFEQLGGGKRARTARERELSQRDKQIAALTAQLARKDEVFADISEVHLRLKKHWGQLRGQWVPHDIRDFTSKQEQAERVLGYIEYWNL